MTSPNGHPPCPFASSICCGLSTRPAAALPGSRRSSLKRPSIGRRYPGAFTCADIVRHLAAAERFVFVEIACGGTSRYPGHDRALAYGKEGVLAYLDAMHEESMALLQKLDNAALEHHVTTPAGAQIPTWRWLQLMAEHEAHHRGQLYLMLRVLGVETPPLFGMTEEQLRERSDA